MILKTKKPLEIYQGACNGIFVGMARFNHADLSALKRDAISPG